MDKKQAQTLIKETFESPFDKNRFVGFVKNLLNEVEEATFIYKGNYIPDAYEQYIVSYERIGKYKNGDNRIDILIVRLNRETSIERARTMQRNFIAGYLQGKYGSTAEKEGALVAFVAPNEEDWRFSLVKMDYRFEEGKKGRMRVKEEFTPARRWSFLVGVNENSHTAQRQLVDRLADDERNPTFAQLEEAFNIEKVTKEFFEKYKDLFLRVKDALDELVKSDEKLRSDFKDKGVDTANFTKKLLGQIVFLYFLQKKGWFGVKKGEEWGTGSKRFFRDLFEGEVIPYKNFFNGVLEPLFYDALALDRSHIDHWNDHFQCKIPFLNGGLFDPINNYSWEKTVIDLPNDLFSNDRKDIKTGDIGDGILNIFDRYNFTVKEDEPLEKEVAVDPEMLGKVFENLLEVSDRKSKGTYYTPREIVHYMCQQSLINYLATEFSSSVIASPEGAKQSLPTKEDIETLIKYGEQVSENELMAMIKEQKVSTGEQKTTTIKPMLPESIRQSAELLDEKLVNIKVCDPAIGSGAFPVGMMSEIVKTRNVLSAYIKNKNRTIYNFKRECIEKSLYGVDIDSGAVEIAKLRLWLSLVVDEDDIKQIKPLPNLDYKIVCGNSLLGVEKDLFNSQLFSELERLKPLLFDEINPNKKQQHKKQIDELIRQITHGHKEFDFEVYFSEVFHEKKGFDVVIGNPPYGFRNVLTSEEKTYFRKVEHIEFSSGDSAELFCKKSFDKLLKEDGILTFIIPKKSLYGDAWEGFRKKYWIKYNLKFLLDSSKAFQDVLLEANAFGLVKNNDNGNIKCVYLSKDDTVIEFASGSKADVFLENATAQIYKPLIPQTVWEKIQCGKINERLVEGKLGLAIGTDFFSDKETNYKLLKGIDIARWKIKSHRWLKNKSKLNWDMAKEFLEPKVICQRLVAHIDNPTPHIKITACYDKEGIIITNTLMSFELSDKLLPEFWLAYINSAFVSWYVYNFVYDRAIRTMDFYNFYIQQIPIPQKALEKNNQKDITSLVKKIHTAVQSNGYLFNVEKQSKVKEYERQIDQMVYELYGLTQEEIKIVEQFGAKDR